MEAGKTLTDSIRFIILGNVLLLSWLMAYSRERILSDMKQRWVPLETGSRREEGGGGIDALLARVCCFPSRASVNPRERQRAFGGTLQS